MKKIAGSVLVLSALIASQAQAAMISGYSITRHYLVCKSTGLEQIRLPGQLNFSGWQAAAGSYELRTNKSTSSLSTTVSYTASSFSSSNSYTGTLRTFAAADADGIVYQLGLLSTSGQPSAALYSWIENPLTATGAFEAQLHGKRLTSAGTIDVRAKMSCAPVTTTIRLGF